MSDTPKTDAFREVVFTQYKEDELTGDGMGNILAALPDIESLERERDEAREESAKWHQMSIEADTRFVEVMRERDGWKTAHDVMQKLVGDTIKQRDEAREECSQYRGLLIRLYNDLFVHHKGEAVREFKELFREENYN